MKSDAISRRKMLAGLSALASSCFLPGQTAGRTEPVYRVLPATKAAFTFCLNTSTVMEQEPSLVPAIEIAAEAGYDGVEIWINALTKYREEGGSLKDLRMRIADLGIRVENAIGFAPWIVDDNNVRMQALEQAKREMDMLAQIGCTRLAAPPAGATNAGGLDLLKAAERFRALVELGVSMKVVPQLEVWGFSKNLNRLSQVLYVAAECGHPQTRILPDVYHLYKGGSDPDALKLISGPTIEIFHLNDYPADPPREAIQDKDRVFPGDGVAPIASILKDLHDPDHPTVLSLELFNRDYWKLDALEVAKTGLAKMREAVEKAER